MTPAPGSARVLLAVAELAAAILEEVRAEAAPSAPERLLSIPEAAGQLGIGRTKLYTEIAAGNLRVVHVGRRVLIPGTSLVAFIARSAA